MPHRKDLWRFALLACALVPAALSGCGTTVKREATEQLLSSDAVDRTVAQIDFSDLSGKKVFFDTQYIPNIKGAGFVNSEYIISSLRQQLIASNCRLQDKLEDADYVVEARVGALGTDSHEVIVGLPANNFVSSAASVLPTLPQLPALPEISLAKKNGQLAAAKIGVFAYHRVTKQPVWQSGIAQARSTARDTWLFGAGPFQRGSIYRGTQFAGSKIEFPLLAHNDAEDGEPSSIYEEELHFARPDDPAAKPESAVQPASAEVEQNAQAPAAAPAETPSAEPTPANPPAAEPAPASPPPADSAPTNPPPTNEPAQPAAVATADASSTAPAATPDAPAAAAAPAQTPESTAAKEPPAAVGPAPDPTLEPRHLFSDGSFLRSLTGSDRWLRMTRDEMPHITAGD